MPISVTCECGARLEIDEKFLGKDIPCPDCNRPLPTKKPAAPPPLELPNHRKKSALAVLSYALAIVCVFIPPGSLAAILTGVFALQRISKNPSKLEGAGLAKAGIIIGGVSLLISTGALLSPFVFGVDQLLREFAMSPHITYKPDVEDFFRTPENMIAMTSIKRPSERWAKWITSINNPMSTQDQDSDLLILVDTIDDAFITSFKVSDLNADDIEVRQKKVLERFFKSDLLVPLKKLHGEITQPQGGAVEAKTEGNVREVTIEMRSGRVPQRALILFGANDKHNVKAVVGVARANRFERLQKDFRAAFTSMK